MSKETKENLHRLIDSIEDESSLKQAYHVLESIYEVKEPGSLWNKLSVDQKKELGEIENDSRGVGSLIDHNEMKRT